MKILFHTLGCKLNFAESSSIGKRLLSAGHQRAKNGESADICIINTCSVTDAADHKGRQAIRSLRHKHPHAVFIVTGCYAQLQPSQIADIEGVDYVIGQNEKFDIDKLVARIGQQAAHLENTEVIVSDIQKSRTFHPSYSKDDRTRCFLKIQDGCDYFCTYCTIPFARGRSRNDSIANTLKQTQAALADGNREIVLTGVNIGDFGKSTGESFLQLISRIDELEGEFRCRISSCEPNLLSDDIIAFVAQSKHFAPHFHIPLQSGSNQVLQIMHRRYTRELFAERVQTIKQLMPNAFIGVDCMVGVRGETVEFFDDYYCFVEQLPVSQLHVFTYSERKNTRMLSMDLLKIDEKEKKRRSEVMHALSADKLREFYHSQAGKEATVLWEAKREGTQMSGFTENYIRLLTPYDSQLVNTFQKVKITSENMKLEL